MEAELDLDDSGEVFSSKVSEGSKSNSPEVLKLTLRRFLAAGIGFEELQVTLEKASCVAAALAMPDPRAIEVNRVASSKADRIHRPHLRIRC